MQVGTQYDQFGNARPINAGNAYATEMAKWEMFHSVYGPPGRPFEQRAYPALMYRAARPSAGGGAVYTHVRVGDDAERERAERQGYVWGGPGKALEALEQQEFQYAELAANRHFTERRMSEKAQQEAAAADESTIKHLPAIPETPIRRRRAKEEATHADAQ